MTEVLVQNATESTSSPGRRISGSSIIMLVAVLTVQCAHFVVLRLEHPVLASNVLQAIAPALAAALCASRAWLATTKRQRQFWCQLAAAFVLWDAAQLLDLGNLVSPGITSPDVGHMLRLAFAFPLLFAVMLSDPAGKRDRVAWLDTAQRLLSLVILFVLVYPHLGMLHTVLAYNVENLAMLFAVALRYLTLQADEEQSFYWNILGFTVAYSSCSLIDYWAISRGAHPGTMIDLCWSLPFTLFSGMVICWSWVKVRPHCRGEAEDRPFPQHLNAAGALGLAGLSLAGSTIVTLHSSALGVPLLSVSFLIFATRTAVREYQLYSAHADLEYSVLHDPLTGLASRTMLYRELRKRLDYATARGRKSTGLLFIDLDRFKTINDGLGHAFGDLLLIEVARLLRAAARDGDVVARQGGDEFVMLLDHVDQEEAEAVAERVVDSLRKPLLLEERLIHVTASVGVVLGGAETTADDMLQDADCAMYKAKGGGKDRAQTFAPTMLEAAKQRLDLELDLRKALAAGEIDVHYQPIYDLSSMSIRGFEALARWRHRARGIIPPGDFIPIAEDTGLIVELGRQVLRQACHRCQEWNERFHARFEMAVNVSAHQITQAGLLDEVVSALRESHLQPSLLKLEVTETVLVKNYQAVEEVLTKARAMGIGICLDDFGTGYSSLSYLLRFPFDVIKIDRSFVHHLDRDNRRAEVLHMIVQLARTLLKEIVAEGVDSPAELAQLQAYGCDMGQGYLFSRPVSAAGILTLLQSDVGITLNEAEFARVAAASRPAEPRRSLLPAL